MTTTVKNIVRKSYPISKKTIDLCRELGVVDYVPTTVPKDVSFELHNTTTEMANALRRCINSELSVLIMDFEDNDIVTDDSFIIAHELRKRINLIPIRQISGMVFSISVNNPTDQIIPIYSNQIINSEESNRDETMFTGSNILTYLRPGKNLSIHNIVIKNGVGYIDGPAYSFTGKVGYSCMELENMDENTNKTPISSMNFEASTYRITVPRQKYIDPVQIIKIALKTLSKKMTHIFDIIDGSSGNLYTSNMEITYFPDGHALFKIYNETYTVGNLLFRYGMDVDNTVSNINCIKLHPLFNYINIEIYHPDPKNIILIAIENIQKELTVIGEAF